MTGIGLAVALRSKSKIVRVVAPLAGFCAAALLHMAVQLHGEPGAAARSLLLIYLARRAAAGRRADRLHRPAGVPRGPADPRPAGRLRTSRLAADRRPGHAVPAADPVQGPVARDLPRPRRVPGHDPAAARGHRARLPARRDDARAGRRRRAWSGRRLLLAKVRGLSADSRSIAPVGRAAYPTFVAGAAARLPAGVRRRRAIPVRPDRRQLSAPPTAPGGVPSPAVPVGADCYPVLRGRPELEATRRS